MMSEEEKRELNDLTSNFSKYKEALSTFELLKEFGVDYPSGDPLEGLKVQMSGDIVNSEIVGEATHEELCLFSAFYKSTKKLKRTDKELNIKIAEKTVQYMKDNIEDSYNPEEIQEMFDNTIQESLTEDSKELIAKERRVNEVLRSLLYLKVGSRLNRCKEKLLITADRKIVSLGEFDDIG